MGTRKAAWEWHKSLCLYEMAAAVRGIERMQYNVQQGTHLL
jgi:hypothetical protein